MDILLPFLSVAMSLEEYLNGEGKEYGTKYITNPDGTIIKRVEGLSGKSFQYLVKSIPWPKDHEKAKNTAKMVPLTQEINWLPAGKIPMSIYHQIEDFFKKVMTNLDGSQVRQHGALEAMAHVVWNPAQPDIYQVRIPTQEVSGAAVDFKFDHLEEGDEIILDIHSHNSMGAFFSGTDNRDDQTNTCYSGVIGKLNTAKPETKFRFNDMDKQKIEVSLEDIFGEEKVACDPSWLKKVTRKTFISGYGGYNGYRGVSSGSTYASPFRGYQGKGNAGNQGAGSPAGNEKRASKSNDIIIDFDDEHINDEFMALFGFTEDQIEEMHRIAKGEDAQIPLLDNPEYEYIEGICFADLTEFSDLELEEFRRLIKMFVATDPVLAALAEDSITLDEVFEVNRRFVLNVSSMSSEDRYIDMTVDDEDKENLFVSEQYAHDKEVDEGEYFMYIPMIDTNVSSEDIHSNISSEYALYLYLMSYGEDDLPEEMGHGVDPRTLTEETKDKIMEFLITGTSNLERFILLSFMLNLQKETSAKGDSTSHASVH